ncbi:hypothetical protein D1632_15430 [Chryseobacterium nematophagum]|uniref:Uncharacterized protein n=1 Tax=Chryseobacterium nematophagum TaxID=2305228 RepID=A0A3M7LA96_9FLAO|nr:hypothetical protein [Chryseobacterium nematophagum]RMZ58955.1 hypothetical protein D1632_15430 [Chryseobacterium nematophagum]
MSEQSIQEKSLEIRNETQEYANTRGKVADVFDDINVTKSNKTTETIMGPDATFKYLYILDENNKAKRMLAGDLGKNIANSALTSIPGAGLSLGANWTVSTSGFYYNITGLSEKSSDNTFNRMMVQDFSGQVAWSNGKNIMMSFPSLLNDTEKTAWRNGMRLTGENFSIGTPRIDVLLLPFIDNTKDFIQYTTLVGQNLFVDNVTPNAYIKIKRIKDENGTNLPTPETYDVDNFTVLQNFPNNLNFGLNWSAMPEGYYQVFVTHNNLTNASSPELIVKAGLTYSQFNGVANWVVNTGSGAVNDTEIALGQPCSATTDELISITDINAGFMVSYSVNNQQFNNGANFVGSWQCGLTGSDNVFYGVSYAGQEGEWKITNGPELTLTRNDTIHIAYYNGVVYVIAEGNGKTYQQFNGTYNLYPRYFVAIRGTSGVGTLSMTLLGKILLT